MMVETSNWYKCYRDSWQNVITPESFVHPAKFSRALIRRIYEHCFEEGWLRPGMTVCDPFAGIALGALHAMQHGLNWVGVELEEKFVALAQQNIDLWNERYSRLPGWGTAQIIQGDSRRLGKVLAEAELCLSSPPYASSANTRDEKFWRKHITDIGRDPETGGAQSLLGAYSDNPRNLGNLPNGDFQMALSSPPYGSQTVHGRAGPFDVSLFDRAPGPNGQIFTCDDYGQTEGQLGQMGDEGFDVAISSPPFGDSQKAQDVDFFCKVQRKHRPSSGGTYPSSRGVYAPSLGNLGRLDACVSSPPYEGSINTGRNDDHARQRKAERYARGEFDCVRSDVFSSQTNIGARGMFDSHYGDTEGQIGKETGDTFWSASRAILEQLYQVLVPGGHAVFVLKAFVRKGKIVDFPGQWRELCEAVGFTTLHVHRAWLVEERGAQYTLDGGLERRVVKKFSFFRRLHAQKYPHLSIDWETVLCLVKPL